MKTILSFFLALFSFVSFVKGQTSQISFGAIGSAQYFTDTKIDSADGSIISVGYSNDNTADNDLFIVKLNSSHQLVWQETIANTGDDNFNRVRVCSNGDYVAVGQIGQAGILRGIICRFDGGTGNLIWSSVSANISDIGEVFWDVKETVNGNLAVAGYESFSPPQTNCFVALLNSAGAVQWSNISTRANSDGFQTINQLPNGNLIVSGVYIEEFASSYSTAIAQLDESTGALISEDLFAISTSLPGNPLTLNSISPIETYIKNDSVIFQMSVFQGFGSPSNDCEFIYNPILKRLNGSIFYHLGSNNANAYRMLPLSDTDFILAASYTSPVSAFISRITNGAIIYNRKINSQVAALAGLDVLGNNLTATGSTLNTDLDGFNLFSSPDLPLSTSPCDISDDFSLGIQPENISGGAGDALGLVTGGVITTYTGTLQPTTFGITNICGFILPVKLLTFTGQYSLSDNSISLNWSTSSEFNSKLFLVEKSIDGGHNYFEIGSVKAAGTSNSILKYQLTDKNPVNGVNLFRLRQVDLDGKFAYSNVVSINVKVSKEDSYSLYPVPAKGFTYLRTVNAKSEVVNVALVDMSGKTLYDKKISIDSLHPANIDLKTISPGLYLVKIISSTNKATTKKLLVE